MYVVVVMYFVGVFVVFLEFEVVGIGLFVVVWFDDEFGVYCLYCFEDDFFVVVCSEGFGDVEFVVCVEF